MKDKKVVFSLYGIHFQSRPVTQETAEEMVRQLRDRDIKTVGTASAYPQEVYVIANVDKGDGHHRIDTAGCQAYLDPDVAREDLNRFLFKAGYGILPLQVLHEPHLLGTKEQREAWEERRSK